MAECDQTDCNGSDVPRTNNAHVCGTSSRNYEEFSQDNLEMTSLLREEDISDVMSDGLPKEIIAVDQVDDNGGAVVRRRTLPYLGLVMAVLSSLFFSLCSLVVKLMENVDPLQLAAFRFFGILLPTIPIVIYTQVPPLGPSDKRLLLFVRSVCGAMSLMMQFYAIRHMPLADASVVIFSAPVFVAIFARVFLKEKCGLFNIVVIILTLLGVVLITKPPFLFGDSVYAHGYTAETLQGAVVAFVGTIFNANVYILLRWLKELHYSVIMLTFSIVAIMMSFGATASLGTLCWPVCGHDRYMIVLLGVLSFAGQVLLTKSLQYEQAGPVAICRTTDIVFAFIWQVIFFHQVPSLFSIGGAFLVTFSVVMTGVRKWILTLPENSFWKQKLRFLGW